MEWKRANSEQFELRQIHVRLWGRFSWRFLKVYWRKLHTKLKFIERAFQRCITCAIWTRNERDMQFWKSVRARIRYSAAAPKSSAAALLCPEAAAFCPDFWACAGYPSAAAPKSQRRGAHVATARPETRVFANLWPKTRPIKAKSPPKHLRPEPRRKIDTLKS